jgi:hypothetical protein
MTFLGHMLAHTPRYIFLLLAYLIWQGVRSMRTRRQSVWRMLVLPSIFIGSGLLLLVLRPSGAIPAMAAWLAGLVAFIPLGLATGPRILEVDRASGRVTRAGSPVSLVRNLCVFGAQYAIAVAVVLHPTAQASLAIAGHAVSGTSVGYFIGWMIALRNRCRSAPDAAFAAPEATPAAALQKS